jgi:hypothetical protein
MKKTVKIILLLLDATIVIGVIKIQMQLNARILQVLLRRVIKGVVVLDIQATT